MIFPPLEFQPKCVTMSVTMCVTISVTIFARKVLFLRVKRCLGIKCKQKSLLVFF